MPCALCDAALDGRCMASLTDQPTVTEYEADGVGVVRIEFG